MKKFRKHIALICTLILGLTFFQTGTSVKAANGVAQTQQKIDETEKEKQELENQQEQSENTLYGLKQEKNTLQGELYNLSVSLEELGYRLEDLTDQIMLKEKDISDAETELNLAIDEVNAQYDSMVIRVRQMYERNDSSIFNAMLNAGSLAKMLNIENYYAKIEAYDKKQLADFKQNRDAIEVEKQRLEGEKEALDGLKKEAEEESKKVAKMIEETQNSVNKYAADIAATEKQIEDYENAIKEKEADLEYLYKVLEEEKAKSLLAQNSTWRDISQVTFEEGDRYLLANLIYCEAGGEPYDGQVAVGAVVINRVLSSVYPDTVTGVIYQRSQFSPAGSGRLAIALAQNKATASCYKAADEAMSGFSNVGTCVYFRTPIPGLTGISIGGHIFY